MNEYLYSTFDEMIEQLSLANEALAATVTRIQAVYLSDNRPWVVGFSGGKDSTAVASLVFYALATLPSAKRKKPVYLVASDTLVEQPVVVDLLKQTLTTINLSAESKSIPLTAHEVYPKVEDTFWVSLLGKGYPAPSNNFRWCTERMKIDPVSAFITERVSEFGEVVVLLGSRMKESATRAQVIRKHKREGTSLARHTTLPSAYIYTPIDEWSNDDVWEFLLSAPTPWGANNRALFDLYKGSNAGECPLVIDKTTPSCGNSRFGCWTCTVVTKDRAMEGLIAAGETWMTPMLEFRNLLSDTQDPKKKPIYRNHKRRTGKVAYMRGQTDVNGASELKHIPGPYWMKYRKKWLERLLGIEKALRDDGHDIELIRRDELHQIRREWVNDPNEPDWSDALPSIYRKVYGEENDIEWVTNDAGAFTKLDEELLRELGKDRGVAPELVIKLLEIELQMDGLSMRRNIFRKLTTVLNEDWGTLSEIKSKSTEFVDQRVYAENIEALKKEYADLEETKMKFEATGV